MANVPKPISRQDRYYNYLINGGDIKYLPKPIGRVEKYLYYLCVNGFGGGGTVTPEMIENAVNAYLDANPVEAGATEEQAAQIEKNRISIENIEQKLEDYEPTGGTKDYSSLDNKPSINSVTLIGNKTLDDLGFQTESLDIDFSTYFS